MFDQSFSADNFRKILDYENRKGDYLASKFFPDAHEKSNQIKECNGEIKDLKRPTDETKLDEYYKAKEDIRNKKYELEREKEELLTAELEKVSLIVTHKKFTISLEEKELKGKKIYVLANSITKYSNLTQEERYNLAAEYFALKQTQRNINKLYKVKQGDRYNIVCQLREILRDKFPKYIVKTDISNFYESIPREAIIKKINDDNLLTFKSKKIIKQILYEYGKLSGQENGIPRGIGISAYLSELYMRKFDEEILNSSNVLYYARYVDDIIAVYSTQEPNFDLKEFISDKIVPYQLTMNEDKTSIFKIDGSNGNGCFIDYLGYNFKFGNGSVKIQLTNSKVEKYKNKIALTFAAYEKHSKYNEKKSRHLLVKRIKFLTGNTRLFGNKKNICVGIYFSNKILTDDLSSLSGMDFYLEHKISSLDNERAKIRLSKLSFKTGFEGKVFYKFSKFDLENIMEVWKDA